MGQSLKYLTCRLLNVIFILFYFGCFPISLITTKSHSFFISLLRYLLIYNRSSPRSYSRSGCGNDLEKFKILKMCLSVGRFLSTNIKQRSCGMCLNRIQKLVIRKNAKRVLSQRNYEIRRSESIIRKRIDAVFSIH